MKEITGASLAMRIKCKDGVYGNITIKRGESPEEMAAKFGREYNLDVTAINRLALEIKERCEIIYKLRDNEQTIPDKMNSELDKEVRPEEEEEEILNFRTLKVKSSAPKSLIFEKTKKDIVSSIYKLENHNNQNDNEKREEDAYNNAKSNKNWSEDGLKSIQSSPLEEGLQSRLQSPSSSQNRVTPTVPISIMTPSTTIQKNNQPQFGKHKNSPIKPVYSPSKKLQAQASSRMHDHGKKSEDRKVYLRNKFNEDRKEAVEKTTFRYIYIKIYICICICLYVYIYIYIYIYICIYICIYIFRFTFMYINISTYIYMYKFDEDEKEAVAKTTFT
jgi:hypothetical protein